MLPPRYCHLIVVLVDLPDSVLPQLPLHSTPHPDPPQPHCIVQCFNVDITRGRAGHWPVGIHWRWYFIKGIETFWGLYDVESRYLVPCGWMTLSRYAIPAVTTRAEIGCLQLADTCLRHYIRAVLWHSGSMLQIMASGLSLTIYSPISSNQYFFLTFPLTLSLCPRTFSLASTLTTLYLLLTASVGFHL